MRIARARLEPVRWPIAAGGAARANSERAAVLVIVETSTGAIGYGEAAPLPGFGTDTLAAAERDLASFVARAPFEMDDTPAAIFDVASTTASPSARFAIESALLDATATDAGVSVAKRLAATAANELDVAVVVDSAGDARDALADGAKVLKIKIGPDDGLARVQGILAGLAARAGEFSLRLDVNRAWPRTRVREYLAAFAARTELPIAFVEEPSAEPLELHARYPLAIALDESLATMTERELDDALASAAVGAFVLKPTVLGGFARCLQLAERIREARKTVVITHALEGPVGTAACCELARAIGAPSPGLGDHPGLTAWLPYPGQLHSTKLTRSPALGLGVAGTPQLRQRDPAMLGRPAIRTATETLTFSDCIDRRRHRPVLRANVMPSAIIAEPTVETILALQRALLGDRPITLIHPRLPAAEQSRQRALVRAARVPPDAALVLFTSGSTGSARGVVLSRTATQFAARIGASQLRLGLTDTYGLLLSMAHAGGAAIVARCLLAGVPVELYEAASFDAGRAANLLMRCTIASLVPTQLAALLDLPTWRPSPKLRAILLGGAAASPALLARAAERGVPFLTTYGMTETFGQIATAPLARVGDATAPLVPLPGVVIEAGTAETPATIRVRAPMLATQYLDGAPIAPVFTASDLGSLDASGHLHIAGRADDVIITGAENVHPLAVEDVLARTPGVVAACAYSIPDEHWGQRVGVALVVSPAFDLAAAQVQWQGELPSHALPRDLAIVPALPQSANGKVDRRACAQLPRTPVRYR